MLCSEWSLVKHDGDAHIAIPLTCRCWTCDYCHPRRKAALVKQAQAGHPTTFITLTVNPDAKGEPSDRARELAHAWRRAVRAARKKYGYKAIPYLAVFETTKRGEPHLHILARVSWIDQRWLSEFMAREIGAPIVDIRRIRSGKQIANYVSKYVGKEPHRFEHSKRYWSTRDYRLDEAYEPELTGNGGSKWQVCQMCLCAVLELWTDHYANLTFDGRMVTATGRKPPAGGWPK